MSAQHAHDLIPRYVDAWNQPDSDHRRAELTALYADDGCIATQSGVCRGVEAIVSHVGEVYDQFIGSGRYRFTGGGAVAHHDCVLFRWEMRAASSDDLADAGMNFFLIADDGRIAADYQFTLGVDSAIGSAAPGRP